MVKISNNGKDWKELEHCLNPERKTEIEFNYDKGIKFRYIAIIAVKPNGPKQPGGQMFVREIEIYK